MIKKTDYIVTLSTDNQVIIHDAIREATKDIRSINVAMSSRLCDIEDLVNLKELMKRLV